MHESHAYNVAHKGSSSNRTSTGSQPTYTAITIRIGTAPVSPTLRNRRAQKNTRSIVVSDTVVCIHVAALVPLYVLFIFVYSVFLVCFASIEI